jgi:hypothetical protein
MPGVRFKRGPADGEPGEAAEQQVVVEPLAQLALRAHGVEPQKQRANQLFGPPDRCIEPGEVSQGRLDR